MIIIIAVFIICIAQIGLIDNYFPHHSMAYQNGHYHQQDVVSGEQYRYALTNFVSFTGSIDQPNG
jgi:hypothetical protein